MTIIYTHCTNFLAGRALDSHPARLEFGASLCEVPRRRTSVRSEETSLVGVSVISCYLDSSRRLRKMQRFCVARRLDLHGV